MPTGVVLGISCYLITLPARANTFGGIISPICLAVMRLMTNSNFTGCSTGRSAGLRLETPDNTCNEQRGVLGSALLEEKYVLRCLSARAITEAA